jgi:hypothetical protein
MNARISLIRFGIVAGVKRRGNRRHFSPPSLLLFAAASENDEAAEGIECGVSKGADSQDLRRRNLHKGGNTSPISLWAYVSSWAT